MTVVGLTFGSVPSQASGAEGPPSFSLKEAQKGWDDYSSFACRLQGTSKTTRTYYDTGGEDSITDTYKQSDSGRLCIREFVRSKRPKEPPYEGYVWCFNSSYAFSLTRRADNKPWVLTAVAGKSQPSYSGLQENPENALLSLRRCISLHAPLLKDLTRQPTFRIVRQELLPGEKEGVVRVEFANKPTRRAGVVSGWMLLDSANHWVLLKSEIRSLLDSGAPELGHYRRLMECEYVSGPPGFPIPRLIKEINHSDDKKTILSTSTTSYTLALTPPPDDRELTLSAFGLPEPKGVAPFGESGSRWYLWFIAFAVLSLAVGGFLWRRVQRRKLTNVPAPATSGGRI